MEVMIDGVRYAPIQQSEVALSVLVPSVAGRRNTFAKLIADSLFGQHEQLSPADRSRVEILILTDAKGVLIGDKRNAMVRMARGEYVVFVDDDDRVEPDYLQALLTATGSRSDCLTFNASVSLNGARPKLCRYSLEYEKDANAADHYQRIPNHITAVRRVLALSTPFPSKQCGEDSDYAARLRPSLRTQYRIDRVLYHYDYNDATTETQRSTPAAPETPLVDVVILSKASTPELKAMCQKAVDTCISNAGYHSVNVLTIEQVPDVAYHGAELLHHPDEFNYNRFANIGARRGNAPWIMIANSDLEFEPGWLDALLNAGRDVVSPRDPSHRTQRNITHDEAGWTNGHHFSGWCFMIRRSLWEAIGGFDESVRYWCSDDVVIEQVRAQGVMPLVVVGARVRHLVSQTLKSPSDDMTWHDVATFNQKYKKRLFANDRRYLNYCRARGISA